MTLGLHHRNDLNTLIDRVHALFDDWEASSTESDVNDHVLHRTKLAVHEWLANLVQHANFNGRPPDVRLEVVPKGPTVRCTIEDNSVGFDLDSQLTARQDILDTFPDRGMGLLMLKSCTDTLSYKQIRHDWHRLEFTISRQHDPWFSIPF